MSLAESPSSSTPEQSGSAPCALASLRGVGKVFANTVTALAGLDLDIHEGEFLSLLGPSGCGKSTVLRLLSGLSSPTSGTIEWSQGRPELGFVFQDPTLMPWSTVYSNVWLPLRFRGISRDEARSRVEEALLDRPRAGHAPRSAADGRAVRSAR
jgi:NitT/TauT family transport system ATP-binding protein